MSWRWICAGYVIPPLLLFAFFGWVRNGPPDAHAYNYALPLMLTLVLTGALAATCLVMGASAALGQLRRGEGAAASAVLALAACIVPAGAVVYGVILISIHQPR